MISLTVKDDGVLKTIKALPKTGARAAEIALDKTAFDVKAGVTEEMKHVFDRPVRYTLSSLKVTRTRNHNMMASVWFKEPDRMGQHYLVPQVEGGPRKTKGFERALGGEMYVPGKFARMTTAGNISPGQIRQILSVLGRAEHVAGYTANITARSRKRNKTPRDYVWITRKRGRLYPGVYERFRTSKGLTSKARRSAMRTDGSRVYQRSSRTRHKAIYARGLRPVMLKGKQNKPIKPLLDFYGVSNRIALAQFERHFWRTFDRLLAGKRW